MTFRFISRRHAEGSLLPDAQIESARYVVETGRDALSRLAAANPMRATVERNIREAEGRLAAHRAALAYIVNVSR